MFGYDNKRRFTLKIPGIGLVRYGTCERDTDKFAATIWENGIRKHLGTFITIELAKDFRDNYIKNNPCSKNTA